MIQLGISQQGVSRMIESLVGWLAWLINAYPLQVLVGSWLIIACLGLYSTTRGGYRMRSYYGTRRSHTRDSNKVLKGRKRQ